MALTVALSFAACSKDDDPNAGDVVTTVNDLKEGQIMIKHDPNRYYEGSFSITAKKVTIDWGDGTALETHTPNGVGRGFEHTYSNKSLKTITITAEDATSFGCGNGYGSILEVHVGSIPTLRQLGLGNVATFTLNTCASLKYLDVSECSLTSFDAATQPVLDSLNCSRNKLTSLNLARFPKLTYLNCGGNQLTSLDVSKNTALTYLSCDGNQLTSLNVSGATALKYLNCGSNGYYDNNYNYVGSLTSLDVSKNTALTLLNCSNNQLTSLNVSGATALRSLHCEDNQLNASALNSLFQGLPTGNFNENNITGYWDWWDWVVWVYGNPGAATCIRSIAENKGWLVQ